MLFTAFVLVLPLMSGCAIDKGTALAADFKEDWAGTTDVAEIRTTKDNTLPFLGSTTGTLILKDGTSVDRVTGLANDLRRYVTDRDTTTGRITVGAITFTVVPDQGRAGETLALWRSLADDDRVLTGDIDDASTKEDRWRIELTTVATAETMTLFKDLVTDGDRHQPLSDVTALDISTGQDVRPRAAIETDFNGAQPTAALAAYQAVTARYTVVSATLLPDRASIVVAESADRAHAHELATTAAPTLGTALKVTGGT